LGGGRSGSARAGGTIAVAVEPSSEPLDPAIATRPGALEALWLTYTPPLTYRRREGKSGLQLIPGVAEQLPTVSRGGRSYSFRLRAGLHYWDGTPVRAGDFAHTVRRSRALSASARRVFRAVARIEARDRPRTVTVQLRRPDPAFPYALASTFAGLVPGTTPLRARSRRPPPGLGPYELVRATPGGGFTLRRNPAFHLPGIPGGYIDEITARPFGDATPAARDVIAGRIDYMEETPPVALLPDLRSKYHDRYAEHPALSTHYLLLAARRPLNRRRVRQAIAYAIDEEKIARLSHGLVQPTCNMLPPQLPGYQRLDPCPWGGPTGTPDLVRARALVGHGQAAAAITILARRGDRLIGRYYANTLGTLGLRARLRLVNPARAIGPGAAGQAALGSLSAPVPDAAVMLGRLVAGAGGFALSLRSGGPSLERLGADALDQPNLGQRAALSAELDKALVRRALALPYGNDLRTTFVSERIDLRSCARFHPLYGNDYSSFCLK
jgi:peptide/nickel transport system substrate-binding protein